MTKDNWGQFSYSDNYDFMTIQPAQDSFLQVAEYYGWTILQFNILTILLKPGQFQKINLCLKKTVKTNLLQVKKSHTNSSDILNRIVDFYSKFKRQPTHDSMGWKTTAQW